MRHAGCGFPNGPVRNEDVFGLPSPHLLMLSTEARWHHDAAVRAGKKILWRAIPRIGKRPAELGWSPARFVDEALNLTDAPTLPIRAFIAWNELDLNEERGDRADDFSDLGNRYTLVGAFQLHVQQTLRHLLSPGTDLHYGAWTPDHHALSHLEAWREAAEASDVIDVHAYGSTAAILSQIAQYRAAFPEKRLALTEWHASGDLESEWRTLAALAELAERDPLFEAAYFFIWRWHDAPGWWSDDWDIEHRPERLALFLNPPVATPAPEPEPIPMPKTREEVIAISNAVSDEVGIPRLLLLACGIAESNLVWDARRPKDPTQDASFWTDVSFGPWQQTVRWSQEYKDWYTNDAPGHHPNTFPGTDVVEAVFDHYRDTQHAARVAARQLKAHYRWMLEDDAIARALARYNWPGGNGQFKSEAHRQNYTRGIREAEAILGTSEPPPPPPGDLGPWPAVSYESHPIPAAGAFVGTPRGVVLHGSRSGAAGNSQDQEYRGTVNWAKNNPAGLGWNVTIADHRVAEHLSVEHWGHHAKAASRHYLSIEFAQPTVDRDITDAQADAAAHWIKTRVWPVWGELWHFPTHAEVQASGETGDAGNSDVYPLADPRLEVLRNRIYERLRQPLDVEPAPEPEPPPPSRAAVLISEIRERLDELERIAS